MVEHAAVNRGVVGSSPTRGVYNLLLELRHNAMYFEYNLIWRLSQVVRRGTATP